MSHIWKCIFVKYVDEKTHKIVMFDKTVNNKCVLLFELDHNLYCYSVCVRI